LIIFINKTITMSAHFNMPEFDHKAFSKYLNENKLTPFSKLNSLVEGIDEAVPFEKDALDETNLTVADINKKYNEMFAKNPATTFSDVAKALNATEQEIAAALFKSSMGLKEKEEELEEIGMFHDPIGYKKSEPNPKDQVYTKKYVSNGVYDIFKDGEKIKTIAGGEGEANAYINKLKKELSETEELEEMANFFMVTQDQKDKIDPDKYSGTKKLVAQALKSDDIEAGQPFTKATIKNILGKDPLKDFNAVLDAEEIEGMGKTGDIRPSEPKTPGVRGRKPGAKAEKEPSAPTTRDKVVGVKDIDGPRPADVTAAEKELGGSKGIDRTIAIDKAGKAIIDKLKNSKEQLKDPKFKEAKRLAFIAYLTRPKSEGGKIGLRKGGETYTNLLNVWDNTVEDLIS